MNKKNLLEKNNTIKAILFAIVFAVTLLAGFSMLSLAPHSALADAIKECGCQPPPPPPITGICTGTPSSAETGATITWTASKLSGGDTNGRYDFSWSGTNGLSGDTQSVQDTYSTAGQKNASVTVYSGSDVSPATFSCSVTITAPPPPPPPTLSGSCSANPTTALQGSSITWTVSPSGGTGSYSYVWSGDDGLGSSGGNSGNSISHTYSSPDTYNAQVVISSGNQQITRSCSVTITATPPPFIGSCSANPTTALQGSSITWTASASGGNNPYSYLWTGDDNLATSGGNGNNTSASISHTYANPGTYNAQVAITSGNQTLSQSCSVSITATPPVTPPPAAPVSYGGGGLEQPQVSLENQPVIPAPYAADYITLTQVPYTGLADYPLSYYFIAGLFLWSILMAAIYTFWKKGKAGA